MFAGVMWTDFENHILDLLHMGSLWQFYHYESIWIEGKRRNRLPEGDGIRVERRSDLVV